MRVAVFSDVHGNLPALEAFVAATAREVDAYLCLGDVVNYGPWSDDCLELIVSLPNSILLEGNHERLFLGLDPVAHEIPLVRQFYEHASARFERADLIRDLPLSTDLGGFTCIHTIDGQRVFRDTDIEIDRDYLIGHTHHAFDVRRSGKRIVNCGSLGQNRKELSRASYAVMDLPSGDISLREIDYPWQRLLAEMEARSYAQVCLDYYRSKLPA
ncbi:metallophosphoesterase family protein [Aureimonas phyllosphaerae]|uniref:metallophosphoesterase family protein n=1 Tax=Aureimonas phyllosphaerae TaxID=1166078 RepID=UPI003A5C0C9C